MPTIESGTAVITHINVFTVEPDKQQLLVDSLIETVNEAKRVEGWISASIHRSFAYARETRLRNVVAGIAGIGPRPSIA